MLIFFFFFRDKFFGIFPLARKLKKPIVIHVFGPQVACLDTSNNSWSLVSPLPSGHGEPGVAVLDGRIYVLGGRSHNKGNRMKYVHVYDSGADQWRNGTDFKERVSGMAACVALVPPAVIGQARSWEQRTKASWEEEEDMDNSEDSSED